MVALALLIDVGQFSKPGVLSYLNIELMNVMVGILQVAFLPFSYNSNRFACMHCFLSHDKWFGTMRSELPYSVEIVCCLSHPAF